MRAAIVTVGLGFGDEGKGMVIQHLSEAHDADLVVRYSGGYQAGHNVVLPDGRKHTFSQFGAGTLSGVPTYLGPQVIVDPLAMHREAVALQHLTGYTPYADLVVHPDCLVATHYHRVLNRARELVRGSRAHGSCGLGIGAVREDFIHHGRDCLTIEDLHGSSRQVFRKLDLLRQRAMVALDDLDLPDDFRDEVVEDCFDVSIASVVNILAARAQSVCLAAKPNLRNASLVLFEGAQGTLLDQWYGFHPHTTWSDVTVNPAYDLIDAAGSFDEVLTLGVTRAFTTRHGAGPLPTFDADLTRRLVDPSNPEGKFQSAFRTGWLDLVLADYAAEINNIDAVALTWLDQFERSGGRVCESYEADSVPWFMEHASDIRPGRYPNLRRSEQLAEHLASVRPVLTSMTDAQLFERLGRVGVTGRGPTAEDYDDSLAEIKEWTAVRVAPQIEFRDRTSAA